MSHDPLGEVRRICLALPQAYEQETWGDATFRLRGKIFVVAREDDEGDTTFSCKAPPGSQGRVPVTYMPPADSR